MGLNDRSCLINHLKLVKRTNLAWYFTQEPHNLATSVARRWVFRSFYRMPNAKTYAHMIFQANTYKTKQYGYALGLFCGINKHGHIFLLGVGSIPCSENAEDYECMWTEWLNANVNAAHLLFGDAAYALLGWILRAFPL